MTFTTFLDNKVGFQALCHFLFIGGLVVTQCFPEIRTYYEKFRKTDHTWCDNNFYWKQIKILTSAL